MKYTKQFEQERQQCINNYDYIGGRWADIKRVITSKLKIEFKEKGLSAYWLPEEHKKNISNSQKKEKGYWWGKKMSLATRKKMSESQKGKNIWSKGRKHSDETKRKMSESHLGQILSEQHKKAIGVANSRIMKEFWKKNKKQLLKKHYKLLFLNKKGEKSASWKGGITPLTNQIRTSKCYKTWVYDIFFRDKFTCQKCNQVGDDISAHHIKAINVIIRENGIKTLEQAETCEELCNINNGIVLCSNCHDDFHKKYGKGDNNIQQLLKFLK